MNSSIRPLFVNTNYKKGGASLAAYRLTKGLDKLGVKSTWYVKNTNEKKAQIHAFQRRFRDRIFAPLSNNKVTYSPHILSTKKIQNETWWNDINLLHFHNLHGDYFNYQTIPLLNQSKPIVWTLHDMWSFTGHCAYGNNCMKWISGCGNCPNLEEYPAVLKDHTKQEWWAKNKALKKSNVHIVTPSQWLASLAKQSFLGNHPVSVVPYGLDTQLYHPGSKTENRKKNGLNPKLFTILMCSEDLADPRKPQTLLCDSLNQSFQKQPEQIQIITIGTGSLKTHLNSSFKLKEFGYISSDDLKQSLFSSADVFLFASRADNLPLVIQESLACGTPVIANKIGGVSEMVRNEQTGWLVDDLDATMFSNALNQAFSNSERFDAYAHQSRRHAEKNFDLVKTTQKYMTIYQSMLKTK